MLDRAEVLARQFGAEAALAPSPLLRSGLEARFSDVGHALANGDALVIAEAVTQDGRIIEQGPTRQVFDDPRTEVPKAALGSDGATTN